MPHFTESGCGEMVDTLVSGASASRRVGSTPIIRTTKKEEEFENSSSFFYLYGTNR